MSKLPPFLPVVNIRDSSQGRRPSFNTSRRTSSAGSAVPTFALTLTESPSDSSSALDADQNSNNTLVSSIRNLKGSQISISMEVGETAVSLRSTGGAVVDEASPQQQQVASRRSSIFKKKLHSSDSIDSSLAADDDGESVASDKSSVSNWSSNRRGGGGERRRSAVIMESTLLAFQRRKSISLNTNNAEQVINRNDTSNSTSSTSDDSDGSTHSGSHTSLHSASLVGNHRTSIMSKEEREIGRLLQTALGKGVASRRASIILSRSSEYGTSARELIDGSSSAALHAPKKSVAKKLMNTLSLSGQRSIPQARYRWNLAIAFVMKSNRAMFLFGTREIYDSEYNKDKLPIVNSPTFSPHSFNFIIKSFETSSDLIVNTKIQVMLSASSKYRVSEDMLVLERLLSHRIHSLKKFTLEQRVKICHKMRYARYPQGKVVIKEGHKALSFYIILSGKVNIFKKLPDRIMHLNVKKKNSEKRVR